MTWPQDSSESRYPGTIRREISVESSVVGDHIVFRGWLRDHWFDKSTDAAEEIHGYQVRLDTIPPDLTVVAATATPGHLPFAACPAAADAVKNLLGLSLAKGFSKSAQEVLGSVEGCTHLLTLVLAMANQRVVANYLRSRAEPEIGPETMARRELMVNACAGWREGGIAIGLTRAGLPLPKSRIQDDDPSATR
jgi:hypothetical protein